MQNAEDRKHESEGMHVHDDERDALKDLEQARQIKDREDESIGMERYDQHHDEHHDKRHDDITSAFIEGFMRRK